MKNFFPPAVFLSFLLAFVSNAEEVRTWTSGTRTSAPPSQNTETLTANDRETIDGILREFYNKYSLPGGISMAISYRERLVYAGAIGYADKQHQIPLTPKHRMRIASISKSVTSIAIMKLVETKKLNLNDEVFGRTGIFRGECGIPEYESRPTKVMVKQLLEHTAGGWGSLSKKCPQFSTPPKDSWKEFMQTVIREHPLEHLPGTKHDYSNFGYCVLGRIIETKSGMTYENYVKKHVLMPCGINGMRIGGKVSGPDEVEYTGTDKNKNPDSTTPFYIDSCGGWIASPIELLKLLARIDGFPNVPDILKNETIKTMATPSAQNNNYALGLRLFGSNNWGHTGGMAGTSTMMVRRSDGFNLVILVNFGFCSAPEYPEFYKDIGNIILKIKEKIQEWPTGTEL